MQRLQHNKRLSKLHNRQPTIKPLRKKPPNRKLKRPLNRPLNRLLPTKLLNEPRLPSKLQLNRPLKMYGLINSD